MPDDKNFHGVIRDEDSSAGIRTGFAHQVDEQYEG